VRHHGESNIQRKDSEHSSNPPWKEMHSESNLDSKII
jgi:hypothetical protein